MQKKSTFSSPVMVIIGLVVLVIAGFLTWYILHPKPEPQVDAPAATSAPAAVAKGPLAVYAKGPLSKLVTNETPQAIEDIAFIDGEGKSVKLSDFKGKVVILNVWATWCAPCKFEMPTLARLEAHYAGKGLTVLPLSVDTEDKFSEVKDFISQNPPLKVYADQSFAAISKYKIEGMPATLILDKQGRQVARLNGETTWDTPEVKALMDKLLAE